MSRDRRRRGRWRLAALALLLLVVPLLVEAQTNSAALDLLFPIGARSTALGAAYTMEHGSEAIWYNPAGIARMTRAELSIDHFSTFALEGADAVALLIPVRRVGTFGVSYRLFNYGTAPATDSLSGQEVGVSSYRSSVLAASFGAAFGNRIDAGLSFKFYQLSSPCSGICTRVVSGDFSVASVDLGMQYRLTADSAWDIGILVSNLGPNLQVHDKPQADPQPARVHAGLGFRPNLTQVDPNLRVRVVGEIMGTPSFGSSEVHLGAEAGYGAGETWVFARGGYVAQGSQAAESPTGPSLGFGLANRRVQLDFARVFESFSTGLGKPPTYISIRIGL